VGGPLVVGEGVGSSEQGVGGPLVVGEGGCLPQISTSGEAQSL